MHIVLLKECPAKSNYGIRRYQSFGPLPYIAAIFKFVQNISS